MGGRRLEKKVTELRVSDGYNIEEKMRKKQTKCEGRKARMGEEKGAWKGKTKAKGNISMVVNRINDRNTYCDGVI